MRPAEHADAGRDDERAEALRRYWEDLDRGVTGAPDDLDPSLAATVRRLRDLHAGDAPAGARDRVWRRLADGFAPAAPELPVASEWAATNGRGPTIGHATPHVRPLDTTRRRWMAAAVIAATLLIAAFALGYRLYWSGGSDRPGTIPAAIVPATPVPPTPTPTPAATEQTLADIEVPAGPFPPGKAGASLSRNFIPPGTRTTWTVPQTAQLMYVLEGQLTVRPDNQAQILRAGGNSAWTTSPAGTEFRLDPGDVLFLLEPTSGDFSNLGTTAVELLDWGITTVNTSVPPFPPGWESAEYDLAPWGTIDLTGGPVRLRLRLIDLAPDATLPGTGTPLSQLVVNLPTNTAGTPQVPYVVKPPNGSIQNLGDDATLYVVTLETNGHADASPVAQTVIGSPVVATPPP